MMQMGGEKIMVDEKKLEKAGLDYKLALARFGDNEMLFEKFLNRFENDEHFEKGKEAYNAGDYTEIVKQIHALKGVSGTLGMERLYQAASDVVDDIRSENFDKLSIDMERMEEEYGIVMQIFC